MFEYSIKINNCARKFYCSVLFTGPAEEEQFNLSALWRAQAWSRASHDKACYGSLMILVGE